MASSTNFQSSAVRSSNKYVIIGAQSFALNKSNTKSICVGLCENFNYEPCIVLAGTKSDKIIFTLKEWSDLLSHQGIISNYFYMFDTMDSITTDSFTIHFERFSTKQVISLEKDWNNLYLGFETVCNLWELLPLIKYQAEMMKNLKFATYFNVLKSGLQKQTGNLFSNALNILRPEENPNSQNVSLTLEVLYLYPEIFEKECALNEGGYNQRTIESSAFNGGLEPRLPRF